MQRACKSFCSFPGELVMKILPYDAWYVVKESFVPSIYSAGLARFRIERGHLLNVPKDSTFTHERTGWEPKDCFLQGNDGKLDIWHTFRNHGTFTGHVWGPFPQHVYEQGIWYIRGSFGPDRNDFSVLRAGLVRRMELDDESRHGIVCTELFAALTGVSCLTIRNHQIVIAPVINLEAARDKE